MATPKTTFGGGFGLAEETTYGNEVSPRTTFLRTRQIRIQRQRTHVPSAQFAGNSSSAAMLSAAVETVREEVGGSIVLDWSYNSLGKLWKHALGSLATTGSGPYAHAYTHARALPIGLSGEAFRGNAADEELLGLKVNRLVAEVRANEIGTVTVEFIGRTGSARASNVTPSYATVYRVLGSHVGTLGYNSATYTLSMLRLTIDNKLARVQECGSLYTSEPERSAAPEFTLEVELLKKDDGLYNEHLAKTIGDATVSITDGTRTVAITLHDAIVMEASDPMEGNGMQTVRAKFQGFWDGSTDYGLAVTCTNAESSGVA
jgi:hypothetical protein